MVEEWTNWHPTVLRTATVQVQIMNIAIQRGQKEENGISEGEMSLNLSDFPCKLHTDSDEAMNAPVLDG